MYEILFSGQEQVALIESVGFEGLTFFYESDRPVFDELTFDVPMGLNLYVTGSGGAGLSTFLKLIGVLIQPQQGRVVVNGKDTSEMSFEEFLPYRSKIGYSFDFGGLFANRTLHDNLILPLLYHKVCSVDEAHEQARRLAVEFGFERQAQQRPALVSGGLRKLICVLRAFIMHPQMMVMDDPFTGIGMEASRKIVRMIQERREAGELKHVFLTSRDEVWPHWLGCDSLFIEQGKPRLEERKGAA
jgi:ABC-type transporter Mla maintaining outer membrane lipid asymmetry ATPase subunit MlaF